MNKHQRRPYLRIVISGLLLSQPLAAAETAELNWEETSHKWGQLIFCQRIYKLPEVKSRLYSFDYERCEKASELVTDVISKYSKAEQGQLKAQAERHAYRLSQNTTEPYHSVVACREYCEKLAKIKDQGND